MAEAPAFTLVIMNKAYSSWSLRAWLALKHTGAPFREIVLHLDAPDTKARLKQYSAAGKVPILLHGAIRVWESLAILEYLAELFPAARLWPADPAARALARSVSAEMHAGFTAMRSHMSMNVRSSYPGRGIDAPGVAQEIERVQAIWRECRQRYGAGGPFLFGAFGGADAMFAPVVSRFRTYGAPVDATARAYMDAIWSLPAMAEWVAAANAEPWVIDRYESGEPT